MRANGMINESIAKEALDLLNVDIRGLDVMDRKLLETIIKKFQGGPVGIESLAAAISEERGTIEDVIEPYLIQEGFILRTPRGRIATELTYQHFKLPLPTQSTLQENFDLLGKVE
uniref:Holliday junction DNA helicase RuvB n=1 Tax=Coxiella burnetii TaxID=777 RepID=O85396_COXBE|nr:Holliday junction DNA helicase RuvB [Coxiella burnetii]